MVFAISAFYMLIPAKASVWKIMFLIGAVPSPSISCKYAHPPRLSMRPDVDTSPWCELAYITGRPTHTQGHGLTFSWQKFCFELTCDIKFTFRCSIELSYLYNGQQLVSLASSLADWVGGWQNVKLYFLSTIVYFLFLTNWFLLQQWFVRARKHTHWSHRWITCYFFH